MESVQVLHLGCVSSVFLASKHGPDQDQKVVKAYHKGHLQVRHWLNITREVTSLRHLKELRVPGVVDLCGTADDATNVYLVFEPCTGGDLYKRLAHKGLFSEAQLCREVVTPLLKVLQSLHQVGIIHRDIKPENIFFEGDGTLRLGDFGLAINAARERPISRVGTLDYMAPEVLAQPSADMIAVRKIKPSQLPSYDCKVDIWALGVLVYEALLGVTPFCDADPQAASLKAQFRPPLPLPAAISAECADFVHQALAKQASKRPSALQLLGHPWVKSHVPALDALWCARPPLVQRTSSSSGAETVSPGGTATCNSSCALPLDPAAGSAACNSSSEVSSSCCELSTSAPAGYLTVLDAACRMGLSKSSCQGATGLDVASRQVCHLVLQKQQPKQTAPPQQLPPHPFAAAAALCVVAAARTPPGPPPEGQDIIDTLPAACSPAEQDVLQQGLSSAPLPIPVHGQQRQCGQHAGSFARQMSSPARLRGALLPQEALSARSSDVPSSPPAPASGARLSALAMSPMRALLGAGRNLVRSRSGAAVPEADGSTGVAGRGGSQPMMAFSARGPLPSPIRGLLQSSRRRPAQTSSSALFAAAQWRPPGAPAGLQQGGLSSSSSSSSSGAGFGRAASNGSSTASTGSRGLDSITFTRTCSMGPGFELCAGLCSQDSSTAGELPATEGCSSGACNSSHAAAAIAAVGPHARQLPALSCSPGSRRGEQQSYAGGKQQPAACLNRYPSAPDPGPLLALSPVRGAGRSTGMQMPPVVLAPCDKYGVQGMRSMWLKMTGVCRKVSKQCSRQSLDSSQDTHCLGPRSP